MSVLGDEPVKTLAEDWVRIHHPFLLIEEFECRRDEADLEGIDECTFMSMTLLRILRRIACVIFELA